ncbi:hypothetical protein IscW_ISCW002170 [Ixodes scapularis]|uniref:Uncharacterized protein n=1 Tax=Ixodes scapularis TaxID=6945 RepID=B7PBU2_IXOSC|nr:hypothetical protein IscW_ISCW002170 [Ixodes scapularis]|eukprot:XP_002408876.1 hypothetical protein IscW_ISCW002170 [Ixodes scapularis]
MVNRFQKLAGHLFLQSFAQNRNFAGNALRFSPEPAREICLERFLQPYFDFQPLLSINPLPPPHS